MTPERCFSPTSATDSSIRTPVGRGTPEPAAFAAETASMQCSRGVSPKCLQERGVGPPFGNPAPGGVTLDDVPPASACSITLRLTLFIVEVDSGLLFMGDRSVAALSAALEAYEQTSGAPCRSPRPLGQAEQLSKSQDRFHRPCVNRNGFPGPKRLPSTRAPPTFAGSARHRSRSFAAAIRLPALVRPPDALAR